MQKINFRTQVMPHLVAVVVFLLITILYFKPVFFENKVLSQHDINQFVGAAKSVTDYREATGEEALWASNMFSGMPSYFVGLRWSNEPIAFAKKVLTFFFPHPISNILLAMFGYYILLLAFRVRPYLAMVGALAFAFSSYMIVGLGAGHNSRIGAIACIPWIIAGIHLAFNGRRLLGMSLMGIMLAIHLDQNHLQITYYLIFIVAAYGLMQLTLAVQQKQIHSFLTTLGVLIIAAMMAGGSFFSQLWTITEYSRYTMRGPSEIHEAKGLSKDYAFDYSNGLMEPLTILVPNVYGGSSGDFLVQDTESKTYQALMRSGDMEMANQLAQYTSAYWGPQPLTTPNYAGAIICFLFILGIFFVERKYVYWLVSLSVFSIVISWGDHFPAFNYFLFDYFPGYAKFRSVTFGLLIAFFAMPLLGMMGLEQFLQTGLTKETKKKLITAFGVIAAICLILLLSASFLSFVRQGEEQLPAWLLNAMKSDRAALLRADAFRALAFSLAFFLFLWSNIVRRISPPILALIVFVLMGADLLSVDARYFGDQNFRSKNFNAFFNATGADQEILKDTGHYRVLNLQSPFNEARTSYFHQSVGGYHGAKLRRYQDLYDSILSQDMNRFIQDARANAIDYRKYSTFNMLNAKYIVYGPERNNILVNSEANGSAWFVQRIQSVSSPREELAQLRNIDVRSTAVMDASKYELPEFEFDSLSQIQLTEATPNRMVYQSQALVKGLAVFSEILYPTGWHAYVDDQEVPVLGANYVLRALPIPAGTHKITFEFKPDSYTKGNIVTAIFSWLTCIVFGLSVAFIAWKSKASSHT